MAPPQQQWSETVENHFFACCTLAATLTFVSRSTAPGKITSRSADPIPPEGGSAFGPGSAPPPSKAPAVTEDKGAAAGAAAARNAPTASPNSSGDAILTTNLSRNHRGSSATTAPPARPITSREQATAATRASRQKDRAVEYAFGPRLLDLRGPGGEGSGGGV